MREAWQRFLGPYRLRVRSRPLPPTAWLAGADPPTALPPDPTPPRPRERPAPFRVCCCGDEILSTTFVRTHSGCCPVPRAPIRVVGQNVPKRGMSLPSLALAGRLIDGRAKQWMPKSDPLVLDHDEPQSLGRTKRVDGEGCSRDRLARLKELGQSSFGIDGCEQQQRAQWRT